MTAFGARAWLALLFVRGVTGRRGAAIGEEQGRSLPVAIRIPAWLRSALHTARDRSVSMPARLPANRGQKPGARACRGLRRWRWSDTRPSPSTGYAIVDEAMLKDGAALLEEFQQAERAAADTRAAGNGEKGQ